MKHLFIIDPIDASSLELNSSVKLAYTLHAAGDSIYTTSLQELAVDKNVALCKCHTLTFASKDFRSVSIASTTEKFPLHYFSAVHMRKDPPFDLKYLTATHILDFANALVINSPVALRNLNEKISILQFPEASIPTLVSADKDQLLEFADRYDEIVIKPLYLHGGRGVKRIKRSDYDKIPTTDTPLFVQPFCAAVMQGEVRAFFAFGQAQAWCLKVPAAGSFVANTAHGAILAPYQPTADEIQRLTQVARALQELGVFLVGFDVIAGRISEINLTSPRLLLPVQSDLSPYHRIAAQIKEHLSC